MKNTQVMCQGTAISPAISVEDHQLEVVNQFTYLSSTTTNNLSVVVELDRCIAKAANNLSTLSRNVWGNRQLTADSKVAVHKACGIITLLVGSESWTSYAAQVNVFHLRYLRRVMRVF